MCYLVEPFCSLNIWIHHLQVKQISIHRHQQQPFSCHHTRQPVLAAGTPTGKLCTFGALSTRYAQRAQTSTDPEDPDFGLWTPGSEA